MHTKPMENWKFILQTSGNYNILQKLTNQKNLEDIM